MIALLPPSVLEDICKDIELLTSSQSTDFDRIVEYDGPIELENIFKSERMEKFDALMSNNLLFDVTLSNITLSNIT